MKKDPSRHKKVKIFSDNVEKTLKNEKCEK